MKIKTKAVIASQTLIWGSVVAEIILPMPISFAVWGVMLGSGVTIFILNTLGKIQNLSHEEAKPE